MFGVDGFKDAHLLAKIRLHPLRPREAVGIGMTEDGVVLARLSASGWLPPRIQQHVPVPPQMLRHLQPPCARRFLHRDGSICRSALLFPQDLP